MVLRGNVEQLRCAQIHQCKSGETTLTIAHLIKARSSFCVLLFGICMLASPNVWAVDDASETIASRKQTESRSANDWHRRRTTRFFMGWDDKEDHSSNNSESSISTDTVEKQKTKLGSTDFDEMLANEEQSPTTPIKQLAQTESSNDADDEPSSDEMLKSLNWEEADQTTSFDELKLLGHESVANYPFRHGNPHCTNCARTYQVMPEGLMYRSYIAGEKEPRFAAVWMKEQGRKGLIGETALGGRVGLIRNGTQGSIRPNGWQLDLEGGVFARIDLEQNSDLDAADFRVGFPLTFREGPWSAKVGYYHISSHVGDEFLKKNPTFKRINYVRDAAIVGLSYDTTEDTRVYGELAYAPAATGGAEPLEMQVGAEYSESTPVWWHGAPYAAVNLHYREEFQAQASVNVVAGWQFRGPKSGRSFRIGVQHYNGKSMQYSFFDKNEQLTGAGLWMDY